MSQTGLPDFYRGDTEMQRNTEHNIGRNRQLPGDDTSVGGRVPLIADSPGGCSELDGSSWEISADEKQVAR